MAKLYHPDLGVTVEKPDDEVHIWTERGWQEAGDEPPDPDAPKPPAKSAGKKAWVDFAVSQGLSPENAKGMTTEDLIDRFGG